MAAAHTIGSRPGLESKPDLTLDVVLYLGIVLLAAILLMWRMPPGPFPLLFADWTITSSQR